MKKTTFVIDEFDIIEVVYEKEIKEFKEYLLSLKGVVSANVSNEDVITIDVCYDEKLITDNIIYMEIATFLNILKIPALISFDRYSKKETRTYKIETSMCCEYCFKIAIEDLLDIPGIVKVDSNYIEQYYHHDGNREQKDTIIVYYDPAIITENRMNEIVKELDI